MRVLHDAAGTRCWIRVSETETTRYLELDGCEEGAMNLRSEAPVFHYLWFHKCSALAGRRPRRVLVLGAGAFTAAKCLALDYPEADVDAVDAELALEGIARRYFRLEEPAFARVRFHGALAEDFLASAPGPYDFVFDDMFDGFQHVPAHSRSCDHFRQVRAVLAAGGVCIKNVIWNPGNASVRAACDETLAALRATFPHQGVLALGEPTQGHNKILLGLPTAFAASWQRLREAGVPEAILRETRNDAS